MGLSNYSGFSAGQQPRNKSEFATSRKAVGQDLRGEDANFTAKRPSVRQNLGSSGHQRAGLPAHDTEAKSQRSLARTQEEMWSEFNRHFRNPNRPQVKVNHHDFLDGSFLTKLKDQPSRRTFFS